MVMIDNEEYLADGNGGFRLFKGQPDSAHRINVAFRYETWATIPVGNEFFHLNNRYLKVDATHIKLGQNLYEWFPNQMCLMMIV